MCGPAPSPPPMPTIVAPPTMPSPMYRRKVETPVLETKFRGDTETPAEKLKSMKSGYSQFRVQSPLQIKK